MGKTKLTGTCEAEAAGLVILQAANLLSRVTFGRVTSIVPLLAQHPPFSSTVSSPQSGRSEERVSDPSVTYHVTAALLEQQRKLDAVTCHQSSKCVGRQRLLSPSTTHDTLL